MNLYPHQQEALEQTKDRNRVAYYYDMGLGKTYIGAEKMMQLRNKVNLIICQKSKIQDWINHLLLNYAHEMVIYNLTKKEELEMYIRAVNKVHIIGIINYELTWRRKQLLQLQDFTLMLDESSLIQNIKAKQSKFVMKLRPENVILLSGTPVSGKYENLVTQANLLGWNISDKLFQTQYVNWETVDNNGFIHNVINREDPYKNIERLQRKLREHGAVFKLTEEVINLPEQTFIDVSVPITKEYKKFEKNKVITVGGKDLLGDTTLTYRLYRKQLAGMHNQSKYDAVNDLLSSSNDRFIIFYCYNGELDRLKGICESLNRPYSEVNGTVKDLTAYESESNSITLCQYQAASKGLNLQLANKIIYFSPTDKVEDWMQSQKRIHRIGQDKPCFYYKLICTGSIEEDIYSALQKGVDYTERLFES